MPAERMRLAERWVRIPSDRAAIEQGCYFDEDAAAKVCGFFERFLRHSIGRWASRPFTLEPWQREFLSRLYGWKTRAGHRRFREAFLEVPKKNGKSTLLAGICLYGLFEEPGAEVYTGAVNRKQASIIFNECVRMVQGSPALAKHLKVVPSTKTITFPAMNSRLEAMSADVESKDGANASTVVLDECHRYKNRKLYDVMKYAGAAREQPLLVNITTAGSDPHGLWGQLHDRATRVISGVEEDVAFLPVVYAADRDRDDLDDPELWKRVNPSLGVIISLDDFRREYEEAKRMPASLANFLRLRLGIREDRATRWLDPSLWGAGAAAIGWDAFAGDGVFAALDISSVSDLTSLTIGAIDDDGRFLSRNLYFMPEDTAARRSEVDQVPYLEWIRRGWMIPTPGNATDHAAIRRTVNELAESGLVIGKVGIDPWNAAQLAGDLQDDGFDVAFVRQGYGSLSGPSKELERRLLAGTVRHDGNPVTAWCVANAAIEQDAAGNIKPSKKRSVERIDGVVSLVMSLGLAMASEGPTPRVTLFS